MIYNIATVPAETLSESIRVAEEVFDTPAHPDQMQPNPENVESLKGLSPDSVLYDVDAEGRLRGWTLRMPTTKVLMQKFLTGEIGEQQLLDLAQPQESYNAVYLCASVTLPEYQRRGIALRLTLEALKRLPLEPGYELFAWPTTGEGLALDKKIEQETGKVVHIKE